MAAADNLQKNAPAPIAIPGLGRALISAGKVSQQAAENAAKKAATGKTPFITELSQSGEISALEIAETISMMFSTPLLDLNAIDAQQLPREPAGPEDQQRLPRAGAQQARQPAHHCHGRPHAAGSGRADQVHNPVAGGLGSCRGRQAAKLVEQTGKSVSESLDSYSRLRRL